MAKVSGSKITLSIMDWRHNWLRLYIEDKLSYAFAAYSYLQLFQVITREKKMAVQFFPYPPWSYLNHFTLGIEESSTRRNDLWFLYSKVPVCHSTKISLPYRARWLASPAK